MTSYKILRYIGIFLLGMVICLPASLAGERYRPGEIIHYNIKQLGVKVGEATLTFVGEKMIDGKKMVLIVFASRGPAFFDNEEIYVDPKSFRPLKVVRDLKIFGGREQITEDYSTEGQIKVRKDAEGKVTETVLEKKGPVDNIYGFIYRYRSEGDFSAQQNFAVRLPTIDLTMKIVDDGNFNAAGHTYRVAVIRSVPPKYTIWMDKGEKRLPLRIAGAVGMGNTVMTMVGMEDESTIEAKKSLGVKQ